MNSPLQQYQLWLFDLDGTLVDSAPDLHVALDHVLTRAGHRSVSETLVREWVGTGARQLIIQALAAQYPERSPESLDLDGLHQRFLDYYQAHIAVHSRPYPGVLEALTALRAAGRPMAVVTNKYEGLSRQLLARLELDHWFDAVVGGDTLSTKKPAPEPLFEACRQLGGDPGQAVMLGDSITDVRAARAAAMPVICVSYGYNHGEDIRSAQPDRVVDSLAALF